jgi:hypothetical protein
MTPTRTPKFTTFTHEDARVRKDNDLAGVRRAADVSAQPVQWLWPGRIPIGKVTLLVGDPGLGKSLIALDVAARITRGLPWPDEVRAARSEERIKPAAGIQSAIRNLQSEIKNSPSSAILLSAEDDLADTIRPRLDALGADCDRVFTLSALSHLRRDFKLLQSAINRMPDCRLIIIDPINAYVGPADSHFHTVVHRVLAPLAQLATEKRLSVLAIAHLRKLDGAAIHRAAGSIGFVAAARSVWTVCRDPTKPGRQLFVPLKSNLAASANPLAYTIEHDGQSIAPVIRWHSDFLITRDEALAPLPKRRGPEPEELTAAKKWLRESLARGRQPAHDVIDEGEERGFNVRTLRRALRMIGGHTEKIGLLQGWWWALADETGKEPAPTPKKQVPFEEIWSPLGASP